MFLGLDAIVHLSSLSEHLLILLDQKASLHPNPEFTTDLTVWSAVEAGEVQPPFLILCM